MLNPVRVIDDRSSLQVAVAGWTLQERETGPVELLTELTFTEKDTPVSPPLTTAVDGPSMVKAAPLPERATTSGFGKPDPLTVRPPERLLTWAGEKATAKLQLAPAASEPLQGLEEAVWRLKSPVMELVIPVMLAELLFVSVTSWDGLLWFTA